LKRGQELYGRHAAQDDITPGPEKNREAWSWCPSKNDRFSMGAISHQRSAVSQD